MWRFLVIAVLALSGCPADLTGAACDDDSNCPSAQVCSTACTCALGVREGHVRECSGFRPVAEWTSGDKVPLFGQSVALNGDGSRAFVGAPDVPSESGAIETFQRSAELWSPYSTLLGGGIGATNLGRTLSVNRTGTIVVSMGKTYGVWALPPDKPTQNFRFISDKFTVKNARVAVVAANAEPDLASVAAETDGITLRLASTRSGLENTLSTGCANTAVVDLALSPRAHFYALSCDDAAFIIRLDSATLAAPEGRTTVGRVRGITLDERVVLTTATQLYTVNTASWPPEGAGVSIAGISPPFEELAFDDGLNTVVVTGASPDTLRIFRRNGSALEPTGFLEVPGFTLGPTDLKTNGPRVAISGDGKYLLVGLPSQGKAKLYAR